MLTPEEDLREGIEPLSDAERRWLRRLENMLRDMPPRLVLIECADSLMLVDRAAARESELADGAARRDGIVLADVRYGFGKVQGVSG